jgi:hypothetical protein
MEAGRAQGELMRSPNPSPATVKKRKHFERHPDKLKAKKKRYRENNPEKFAATGKRYRDRRGPELLERQAEWRSAQPQRVKDLWSLRTSCVKYGITIERFFEMLDEQGGLCAICLRPCKSGHRLAIDHDHTTGQARGLLCFNCNTAIGKMDEDPGVMRSAADYIERYDKGD